MKNSNEIKSLKQSAMSKAADRIIANKDADLNALSGFNLQLLANAQYKVESKSVSYVYGLLKGAFYSEDANSFESSVKVLVGKSFPTRALFTKSYASKHVSVYGGLATLKKLNPSYQLAAKVKRQDKAVANA